MKSVVEGVKMYRNLLSKKDDEINEMKQEIEELRKKLK